MLVENLGDDGVEDNSQYRLSQEELDKLKKDIEKVLREGDRIKWDREGFENDRMYPAD